MNAAFQPPARGRKGIVLLLIGGAVMIITGLTLTLDVLLLMSPELTGHFEILTYPLPVFILGTGTALAGLYRLRRGK